MSREEVLCSVELLSLGAQKGGGVGLRGAQARAGAPCREEGKNPGTPPTHTVEGRALETTGRVCRGLRSPRGGRPALAGLPARRQTRDTNTRQAAWPPTPAHTRVHRVHKAHALHTHTCSMQAPVQNPCSRPAAMTCAHNKRLCGHTPSHTAHVATRLHACTHTHRLVLSSSSESTKLLDSSSLLSAVDALSGGRPRSRRRSPRGCPLARAAVGTRGR